MRIGLVHNSWPMIFGCLATLVLVSTWCRSFTSTPITRTGNDQLVGDSNGWPRWGCRARSFAGVPIKLKVQTHVDVFIDEQYCLLRGPDSRWTEARLPWPARSVRVTPVNTEQTVLVDIKRPAAGTAGHQIDFTPEQYLASINGEIDDRTLHQSAALIGTLLEGTSVASTPSRLDSTADQKWLTRTVAYERFDLNEPDYKTRLDLFVQTHLNCGPPDEVVTGSKMSRSHLPSR